MTAHANSPERELLACPFCGGEPQLVTGGPGNWYVRCLACKCATNDVQSDHAVTLWNTRAPQRCEGGEAEREATSYHKFWIDERDRRIALEAALSAPKASEPDGAREALVVIEETKALLAAAFGGRLRKAKINSALHRLAHLDRLLRSPAVEAPRSGVQNGDDKLRLFLAILQSAGGETSGNDDKWSWINYFCDDAEPLDTFNQASKRTLTRVTHGSDSDNSQVYLTKAGEAFLAALPEKAEGREETDEAIARRLATVMHGDDVEWRGFVTKAHHWMSLALPSAEGK